MMWVLLALFIAALVVVFALGAPRPAARGRRKGHR